MTIIVSVKINNGIVIASDSMTSFFRNDEKFVQSYDHENKIFNLYKGLPIGGATCGAGNIGTASISTLSKDLRKLLCSQDPEWKVDPENYTVLEVAEKAKNFLASSMSNAGERPYLTYWVFGYSAGKALPELWSIQFQEGQIALNVIRDETQCGPNWSGQEEALDRLLLGRTSFIPEIAGKHGQDIKTFAELILNMGGDLTEPVVMPAMPIQDAIDLANYMVETTRGFVRFSISRAKTVGGQVEIAAITKHEGFKWVSRKYFYPPTLNP